MVKIKCALIKRYLINMKNNNVIRVARLAWQSVFFRVVLFFGLYLYFSMAFYSGGVLVPDRSNYVEFFSNPELTRFEPIFKIWGQTLKYLGADGFLGLYITASMAYLFSYKVCSGLFKENFTFAAFFIFIFFAYLSIFSFIQIRASIAIWIGLFIFFNRHKIPGWLYLLLMCGVPMIHFSTLPFSLVCIYFFYFKRIGFFEFCIAMFFLILLIAGEGFFIEYLPHGEYYEQYFSGELRSQTLLSPMVLSYFLVFFFSLYFSIYAGNNFHGVEKISFMGFPFVFLGYVSGVGLLIKFAAPFMFITVYFFVVKLCAIRGKYSGLLKVMMFFGSVLTIAYPFYKYA